MLQWLHVIQVRYSLFDQPLHTMQVRYSLFWSTIAHHTGEILIIVLIYYIAFITTFMEVYLWFYFIESSQVTPVDYFKVLYGDRIGWTVQSGSDLISYNVVNQSQTLYRPLQVVNKSSSLPVVGSSYTFLSSDTRYIESSVAAQVLPSKFIAIYYYYYYYYYYYLYCTIFILFKLTCTTE